MFSLSDFMRGLLPIVFFLGLAIPATADSSCDFTVNGIHYNFLTQDEVAVTYLEYESGSYGGYYNDYKGSITVPATVTYNDVTYKVTAVGRSAFIECSSLTSVSLPSTITSIGDRAFMDCNGLLSVSVPQSVTYIGSDAFNGCVSLYSVSIPKRVKSIGPNTFANCQSLTSITLPDSILTIGASAFHNCLKLSTITIPEGVKGVGDDAFYGTPWLSNQPLGVVYVGKVAYKYSGTMPEGTSLAIKEGTLSIGKTAFSGCSGLESITIPESVTTIGVSAFTNCTSLKAIIIPKSIVSMGGGTSSSVFYGCSALKDVTILCPNVGPGWFREVDAIENLTFGDAVKSVGGSAFYFCKGLTSVILPESVTSINSNAFAICSNLASVTIRNNAASIASDAFMGTPWLDNQPDGLMYIGQVAYKYKGEMPCGSTIVIKEGTVKIADQAFYHCSHLKSVVIPQSMRTIADYAFDWCDSLESITIPEGVNSIGSYVFYGCKRLKSASIPVSATSIGSSLFVNCDSLESVSLPEGMTSIPSSMFSGCKKLSSIVLPSTIESLDASSFSGCTALQNFTIPKGVTSIGNGAFYGCTSITDISLPVGLNAIGENAFRGCAGISTITIPRTVTKIGGAAFADCPIETVTVNVKEPISIYNTVFSYYSNYLYYSYANTATLYVPDGCKEAYEQALIWKDFKEILELPSAYSLYGSDLEILRGKEIVLPINLRNEEDVKLCQFDLQLPAGVTVATKSNGKLDARLTERAENHTISSKQLANGNYRFVISSMENDSFVGNEGTLVEVTLEVSATMEAGDYTVKVLNAELSVPEGNDLLVVKPADTESKLTVKDYTPGDVNNDGSVSVTDVGCAINYILEQVPSVFIFDAADMNADKSISVTDVGIIINLILDEGAARAERKEQTETVGMPGMTLVATSAGYDMLMEGKSGIIGFQFDVEMAEGTGWHGACPYIRLSTDGDSDHLLTYRRLDNGRYRVVCYSPTNETFDGSSDHLLTIDATGDIAVSDIRLTTAALDELRPAGISSTPTGISNLTQGTKVSVKGGTLQVTADRETTLRLYTLGGTLLRSLHIRKGTNSIDGLHPGVYFVGNQKIIVK